MPPLLKYTPHLNQSLAAPTAAAPQVTAPQVDNTGAQLVRQVDDFLKTAGPILGQEYRREQTARVDDVLLQAGARFDQWQAEYEQNRRGAQGVNAAADYASKWQEICAEAVREFKPSAHEIYGDLLKQRLGERGTVIAKRGLAFAGQQKSVWEQSQWQSQQDEYYRSLSALPDAGSVLQEREALKGSWAAKHPGEDHRAAFNQIDERTALTPAEARLAQGDTAGAREVLAGPLGQSGSHIKLGDYIAKEESGSEGVHCVAYDTNGGTSYGKWQLSSKQGSFQEWVRFLGTAEAKEKYGAEACAEINEKLTAAGNPNTGTKSGRPVAVYKELARKYPELMEESQREYMKRSHYDGALRALPEGARQLIASDEALQEMLFSTAVQFGAAGGARLLRSVWRDGMGKEDFVRAAYARRGDPANFKSSSPQVREAVRQRFAREVEDILRMPLARSAVDPARAQALLRRADALDQERQRAAQAEMANGLKQFAAASEDGHILDLPFSQEQVLAAFGPEQGAGVWRELEASRALAVDMNQVRGMSPNAMNEFLASRQPQPGSETYIEDLTRWQKLSGLVAQTQERMAKDPAAYALGLSQPASQARETLMANLFTLTPALADAYASAVQGAQGQFTMRHDLFTRDDRKLIGEMLMTADDPVAATQRFVASFGPRAGQALAEVAGSLSPTMHLIASGMRENTARLLLQAERDKDFEKRSLELLAIKGADKTMFEEAVDETCAELNRSFLAGGDQRLPQALRGAVSKLALTWVQRLGIEPEDAIEKAYGELVGDRYEFWQPSGIFFAREVPACRIPAHLPVGNIKAGLKATLRNINIDNVSWERLAGAAEGEGREALAEAIAANGHFITNSDESGVVLFLGSQPVWGVDGLPITYTWDQLQAEGARQKANAWWLPGGGPVAMPGGMP